METARECERGALSPVRRRARENEWLHWSKSERGWKEIISRNEKRKGVSVRSLNTKLCAIRPSVSRHSIYIYLIYISICVNVHIYMCVWVCMYVCIERKSEEVYTRQKRQHEYDRVRDRRNGGNARVATGVERSGSDASSIGGLWK